MGLIICKQCGAKKEVKDCHIINGRAKFCSVECHNLFQSGTGVSKHNDGYIMVKYPSHNRANAFGFVYEHVLVMEKLIGRKLCATEEIHHINRVRDDNTPSNLMLFATRAEHQKHHIRERLIAKGINPDKERKCSRCHRVLPIDRFTPSSSRGKRLLSSRCKACLVIAQRERRQKIKNNTKGA